MNSLHVIVSCVLLTSPQNRQLPMPDILYKLLLILIFRIDGRALLAFGLLAAAAHGCVAADEHGREGGYR